VGGVEVEVVVAAPEERAAALHALDVVGVHPAAVEHVVLVVAEVVADRADDAHLGEEARGQREVHGGAAEHAVALPNGVLTASNAIEPTTTRLMRRGTLAVPHRMRRPDSRLKAGRGAADPSSMALQSPRLRAILVAAAIAVGGACTPASVSAAEPAPACAPTGAETVATDKARYPTEDLVRVSGTGYAPGCEVIVRIVRPDGSVVTGDGSETTGSDIVTTRADGDLAYDYRLATITGTYRIYVVHPESGAVLASAEFEDAAILNNLRMGSAAGAENYVFAAGDVVYASGSVSNSRNYRFSVIRSDGTTSSGACTPRCRARRAATRRSRTRTRRRDRPRVDRDAVHAPTPGVREQRHHLHRHEPEHCRPPVHGRPRDLVRRQRARHAPQLVRARDERVPEGRRSHSEQADWSITWIPPSGSTACANTLGTDRPDGSAAGRLPDAAGSYLQYAPGASGSAWNLTANFDAGASCPPSAPRTTASGACACRATRPTSSSCPRSRSRPARRRRRSTPGPPAPRRATRPASRSRPTRRGSSFQCRLDGPGAATGSYAPCTSPRSYSGLAQGSYTFSVYATDSAGNVDSTPATRSFTVDSVVPAVTLTAPADGAVMRDATPALAGAAGNSAGDSPTVTVDLYSGASVSGSPVRTFSVARSGAAWSVADSDWDAAVPLRAPLADGVYTAQASQSDDGGSGTSGARTFRVDTAAPATSDDVPASTQTNDVTVTLTALDSGSGVAATYYTTDDSDPADAANPSRKTYNPASKPVLRDGEQIRYYSVDSAGNAEPVRTSGIAKVDRGSTLVAAEGDQEPNPGSSLTGPSSGDWLGYWNSGRVSSMVDPNALDDYFIGGTKEEAPLFWAFQHQAGGVTPAKSNIQAAWTSIESTRNTTFLYMAFKREGTTGNTFLTFELNQGTGSYMNATGTTIPCRTNGDILVSFETGNPPKVTVYKWVSTAPGPPSCPEGAIGTFVTSGPLSPSQFQDA
jgi:hypothetical protein